MPIALSYAARSHTGLVRQTNQDSGYAGPHLLVVADGMGGHAAGDVASSIAIGHLVPLDGDTNGARALASLEAAIAEANDEIAATTADDPSMAGMGTTVTALLRTDRKLAMAHIGDSRGYLLRDGELTQITKDHTYVQRLVDEGQITAEEADHHPQGNLVTRVLTGQSGDEPDVSWREARQGDRYLLCSDGVCGYVGRDTLAEVLTTSESPQQAADRLIDLSLRSGAPDNATAIVADVVSLAAGPAPSQTPQVVGAAAARRSTDAGEPQSPAEKAAALRREAIGVPADTPVLAEEEDGSQARTLRRALALVLAGVVVLGAVAFAFYRWTQSQYFLADDGGRVAIYRGLDQAPLGITLSHVAEVTDVEMSDLPAFYRTSVANHVAATGLDDARSKVAGLRLQAQVCHSLAASGGYCGDTGAEDPPTTAPTTGASTAPTSPPATTARTTPATPLPGAGTTTGTVPLTTVTVTKPATTGAGA